VPHVSQIHAVALIACRIAKAPDGSYLDGKILGDYLDVKTS
jgi:hypothetical protein